MIRNIRKNIIYLHQQPFLFSGTVLSNVAYGLRFTSLNRKRRRESVIEPLEWAGLTEVLTQDADLFSFLSSCYEFKLDKLLRQIILY